MKNITSGQHKDRRVLLTFCGVIIAASILDIQIVSQTGIELLGFNLKNISIENIRLVIFFFLIYLSAIHIINIKEYQKARTESFKREIIENEEFIKKITAGAKTKLQTTDEAAERNKLYLKERKKLIMDIEEKATWKNVFFSYEDIYYIWVPEISIILAFVALKPRPFM